MLYASVDAYFERSPKTSILPVGRIYAVLILICKEIHRRGEDMAYGFPLYIDLKGNNCVVLGGGDYAADKVAALLRFDAKVTVISPTLCDRLQELDKTHAIRYIPRRYYRGDCTNAYICVAATGTESVNIAVSDECKAKGIPVNVSKPAAFGNYLFPQVVLYEEISLAISGSAPAQLQADLRELLEARLPELLAELQNRPEAALTETE